MELWRRHRQPGTPGARPGKTPGKRQRTRQDPGTDRGTTPAPAHGHAPRHRTSARPRRRWLVGGLTGLLVSGSLALVAAGVEQDRELALCGPGGQVLTGVEGPAACMHVDEPPPGVDVTEPVSTAELKAREGAGLAAYEAAEELGVPMPAQSVATSPAVRCDGDGTSGYRVQAMYVVEAGRPNRHAALLSSFKRWAAGVDDVFNRSAALTGGVRNVRYVTEPGPDGTCEAVVLNVTVPSGALNDFTSTINAVRALGYDSPARKYFMWTDATRLCGVASMYVSDTPTQGNPNNGSSAQYSRTDSGCWGFGNGTSEHSVEAHELLHNLGGVQRTAPHATEAGHCWDERDAMCYSDGTTKPMVQVCPPEREYLFDCNSDDYFSTYPEAGSYLATRWNAADNRFLIGGGDGSGGGSTGTPTTLGGTVAVNNPAVPGLATQVSVAPALPSGRTLTSVTWTSSRRDCTFSAPTEVQSTVTCSASGSLASTWVDVKLVDSTGATRTLRSPLTFSAAGGRAITVALGVAGQDGDAASVCTGASFPVTATVVDSASGAPVKGLAVSVTRRTAAMAAPARAGRVLTAGDGTGTLGTATTSATTYAAAVTAGKVYGAATSTAVTATPSKCDLDLAGTVSAARTFQGDPVTVSGTLTRSVAGATVPVALVTVPVRQAVTVGTATRQVVLGTARTAADGRWSVSVLPTTSGPLSVSLPGTAGHNPASLDLGQLTVDLPTSALTAVADRTSVGYGGTVVVTGRLTRTAGESTAGVSGRTVAVTVAVPGRSPLVVGTGRTAADGSYRVSAVLKVAGQLRAAYSGAVGVPAASVDLGAATVGTWSTATTLTGATSSTGLTLAGQVTRTHEGADEGAGRVRVRILFTPTGGAATAVGTATTTSSGAFTVRVRPRSSGTYTATTTGNTGHQGSTSDGVAVTVG